MMTDFETITLDVKDQVATVTLNRPDKYNAITPSMPGEIQAVFDFINTEKTIHVAVLKGAGKGFCGGYDLNIFTKEEGSNPIYQDMPWDPTLDFQVMSDYTKKFMSIWRCSKPVIAQIHGDAIAGGSDIALCCDLVVMAENSRIGYPPTRIWGCPTTAMWIYRLGIEKAKYMLLSGDLINGIEAEKIGLIQKASPLEDLEATVSTIVNRIKSVPINQLSMSKKLVNQAYENMGLAQTQTTAVMFDGIARHTPEGFKFRALVNEKGFKEAVKKRDG